MSDLKFRPIVIMGAARSGTNALRDALTSLPNLETWPCDEINGIWKYKSLSIGHDNLARTDISEDKIEFIRQQFIKQLKKSNLPTFIIEKTCANSMRPGFVDAILPEAKYIFIIRSGPDVIKSATKRWRGEFELDLFEYWRDKIKYIPATDFPYYFYNIFLKRLLNKLLRRNQLEDWGPTHPTLNKLKNECSIEDIAALQWSLSVISSWFFFRHSNPNKCMFITYDKLLSDPTGVLNQLEDLLTIEIVSNDNISSFTANLFPPKPSINSYKPTNAKVEKYYNSAVQIYKRIND